MEPRNPAALARWLRLDVCGGVIPCVILGPWRCAPRWAAACRRALRLPTLLSAPGTSFGERGCHATSPDLRPPDLHPPMMTNTSMVSDARTNTVSKEANFMTPSASYPAATVGDSINRRHRHRCTIARASTWSYHRHCERSEANQLSFSRQQSWIASPLRSSQ